MTMNEQEFRTRLDAELSQIEWTSRNRQQVLAGTFKGGKIMKRKVLISLTLAALLLVMALTAYAATVMFSPKADAGLRAAAGRGAGCLFWPDTGMAYTPSYKNDMILAHAYFHYQNLMLYIDGFSRTHS